MIFSCAKANRLIIIWYKLFHLFIYFLIFRNFIFGQNILIVYILSYNLFDTIKYALIIKNSITKNNYLLIITNYILNTILIIRII